MSLRTPFLKLINSLNLNKENIYEEGVWLSDLNKNRSLSCHFSIFSLVLIEKICQTLKTVFKLISKHLEVR